MSRASAVNAGIFLGYQLANGNRKGRNGLETEVLLVPIDDPADPRTAAYRQVRERDLVGREGRFIAEGAVVVDLLLRRSRYTAESLLIAAPRVAGLGDLLPRVPEGVPVFVASQIVMDAIVGFPIHRGILAIGHRGPVAEADALLAALSPHALVLGLFGIANHDNMGGLFRNAAAFGVEAVLLDAECCDPLYRKAIRVSVGAALTVPFARLRRNDDAAALLAANGIEPFGLSPAGALPIGEVRRSGRTALLLGAEGPGLPDALLDRIRTVRIPMVPGLDSLNVATAAGIALYQFAFGAL